MTRLLALSLALLAAALPGCQSQYTNYPEVPSARGLSEDPNSPGCESAMIAAVRYVAMRYPPGSLPYTAADATEAGRVTVNYPMVVAAPLGTRKSFYERMARQIGPEVVPLTPENVGGTAPVFYVTRAWLRGVDGQVDVMRPMPELPPGPDGKPVYQTVTVRLKGSIEPWYVVHARAWEPGIDPLPTPYFLPDVERVNQFRYSTGPKPVSSERQFWRSSQPESEGSPAANDQLNQPNEPPPVDTVNESGPEIVPAEPK
ncbi:MAG: hypothetical protein JNK25_00065 [Phycisphaerae bacterium]|nr:hypothetical protein [Phycisphaerae bacterium]